VKIPKINYEYTHLNYRRPEAYQANTLAKSRREGIQDVHGRVEPLRPPLIIDSRLTEILDLLLKDCEDGAGGITRLELCGERMCKEVLLCALFIRFQGVIDD
jgi:signal transduction histidine kinase